MTIGKTGYLYPSMITMLCRKNCRLSAIDPTFWQALGKATDPERYESSELYNDEPMPRYLCKAMRFYSLILTGGDTEKFWKELLHTN